MEVGEDRADLDTVGPQEDQDRGAASAKAEDLCASQKRIAADLGKIGPSVGVTLVGDTKDQLQEKFRLQKASHWPFSLR